MITGSFMGLNLALRGLYASQKALELTSENVANSATKGYTRKVAEFKTFGQDREGIGEPGFGMGADYVSSTRMRDKYLDTKIWNQQSIASEWDIKEDYYTKLGQIIDEPSVSSLTTVLDDFYLAMQEYAKEPASTTKRYAVRNSAEQLTSYFNEVASKLEEFQVELNDDIKTQVEDVNSTITKIRDLNERIYNTEITGGDAGLLRDERGLLIDELSKYGNVEVTETTYSTLANGTEDKRMTIMFGGTTVVDHKNAIKLTYTKSLTKKHETDVEGLYHVTTETGARLDLSSGKLKATLEVRDGTGSNLDGWVKGVPYYVEQMNEIARTFAKGFNEGIIGTTNGDGFADGYTFNSGDEKGGQRLFTIDNMASDVFIDEGDDTAQIIEKYEELTAKNISISSDILDDIGNMFSSFTDPTNRNDTDSILKLLEFKDNNSLLGTTNLEDYISGMITNVGVDAETAKGLNESHESVMLQLTNRREGYSGVSMNEESANLVRFQQMYNASAKIISVFSEVYYTLVNTI